MTIKSLSLHFIHALWANVVIKKLHRLLCNWIMDVKHLEWRANVFTCHTCNFLNLIFPWKQFVIRRPLNGKHIIFLKGHRVAHNPPTVPINKMASFSDASGALGSEGGLPLNFKGSSGLEGHVTIIIVRLKWGIWKALHVWWCKPHILLFVPSIARGWSDVHPRCNNDSATRDRTQCCKIQDCCISWVTISTEVTAYLNGMLLMRRR